LGNRVVILASGALGFHILESLDGELKIAAIATDNNSHQIIDYANNKRISLFIGNPRKGKLADFLKEISCDTLFSINYLFLVENDVLRLFKFPINFHGSLLPKYRGRTPHVWAIINNETKTGITAHFMNEGCDTGDIVFQKELEISLNDTGNSILLKYFNAYPDIVREIVKMIDSNDIRQQPQNELFATKYGKRTPLDGKINWDWHKERIYNWVRALSSPYPGAFSYYKDKLLIIDEIKYSNIGYDNEIPNGSILAISPNVVVKTSNGAIEIVRGREINNHSFVIKTILE
jgi:methionyl-tRNA formyltransferase